MLPTILIRCRHLSDEENYFVVQSFDHGRRREELESKMADLLEEFGFDLRDMEIDPWGGV